MLISKKKLTLKIPRASSHISKPRESDTSIHPRYLTANEHFPVRIAISSANRFCDTVSVSSCSCLARRRNESRNERRNRDDDEF